MAYRLWNGFTWVDFFYSLRDSGPSACRYLIVIKAAKGVFKRDEAPWVLATTSSYGGESEEGGWTVEE